MGTIDLNLIRTFVAIFETQSVSGAARRLSITQPSVSYSLNRLRDLLHDPLFTRSRDGMVPTFNATQLFASFKAALDNIESAISATRQFDPSKSERIFRLALSDLGELYFLPFLVREFQAVAPSVGLEILQIDSNLVADWLLTGYVDAVVGNLQFVGREARKATLFSESYSCLLCASHPSIGETLTLEEFVAANHVVVSPFTGHHLVEDALSEMGLKRKIVLRVPHFTSLFSSIATTDLVLTLPTRVARAFAADGRMKVLPLPFQIQPFEVNLYWYPHAEDSGAQQWFCDTVKRTLSQV
jgi:DNA-binding transcriptional LysR family regulator